MTEHNVRDTSLKAYADIREDLGRRQMIVLAGFYRYVKPTSDKAVSEMLGLPINTVTPRRNELVDRGLIYQAAKGPCPITGRTVMLWTLTESGEEIAKTYADSLEDMLGGDNE